VYAKPADGITVSLDGQVSVGKASKKVTPQAHSTVHYYFNHSTEGRPTLKDMLVRFTNAARLRYRGAAQVPVGTTFELHALLKTCIGDTFYRFKRWSHGGDRKQTILVRTFKLNC